MSLRTSLLLLLLWRGAPLAAQLLVEVVPVSARVLERKSKLPGELLPFQAVDLHARIAGYVERVEVDTGSVVKEGQLLVTIAAPEMYTALAELQARVSALESQRAEAEAKLLAAESTYQRIRTAAETPGAVAGNDLVLAEKAVDGAKAVIQSLQSSIAAAKAAVTAQQELLEYLRVTAPFGGLITRRYAHPGALAGPGAMSAQPLLRLEQHDRLRLIVAVPESETGGILKGARVGFTVPAYPGESFSGVVARLPRTLDPMTRTMPVELDVVNVGSRLSPGMYAEVRWTFRRPRPSLLLPPSAIVTTTERTFVVRATRGKAEWVDILRGETVGDLVEVFGGLQAGDLVVKRATDEIRAGSALEAKR